MKNLKVPILWVMLIGLVIYNGINAFVVVDQHYTYVENETLFSEFELTRVYEIKLDKIKQERQSVLDSLELRIRTEQTVLSENSDETEILAYKQMVLEYEAANQRFEQQNQSLMAQYDDIIWKQLNAYVTSYGEEKGYQMILGVSGKGNVMYANGSLNVTEELIDYVNEKYEGE